MDAIRLSHISKRYGSNEVLSDLSLAVEEGSFCSLLGPSGCGKTTLLNIIGGLDQPSNGEVSFDSEIVFSDRLGINIPTERRKLGYVFQSYALWPHMTVLQNIGYPLKIQKVKREERLERSRGILERLELDHLADRYPFQLSGGQQQRVAIARSLVYRPRLLLLDEPLSNLDAQLRERARSWLKQIHASFKLTTILVTHDQAEALSLSDKVVLMSKGRIEQIGDPKEIYEKPQTAYAADFVGGANLIEVSVKSINGNADRVVAVAGNGTEIQARAEVPFSIGADATIAVRPQKIHFADMSVAGSGDAVLPFAVGTVLYQGAHYETIGKTPIGTMRVLSESGPRGQSEHIILPKDDCLCVRR